MRALQLLIGRFVIRIPLTFEYSSNSNCKPESNEIKEKKLYFKKSFGCKSITIPLIVVIKYQTLYSSSEDYLSTMAKLKPKGI
jgi:hypothetical protein